MTVADPLDDIPDGPHKDFMQGYMRAWPYPLQTQYRVGQGVNAEFDGVLQRCEVLVVDCSLMQVLVTVSICELSLNYFQLFFSS